MKQIEKLNIIIDLAIERYLNNYTNHKLTKLDKQYYLYNLFQNETGHLTDEQINKMYQQFKLIKEIRQVIKECLEKI
tara:strand:- start:399 stop:629 length:231 start_codon:yes stop_codon:yes gene_type:complete